MKQYEKADIKQPVPVDLPQPLPSESQSSQREPELITAVLRLALGEMSLNDLLRQTLALVLASPEFMLEPRGCIFLVDHKRRILRMMAQQGLSRAVHESCDRLPMGRCVCGQAAETGKVIHIDRIDHQHEIHHPKMKPHGHYCVPIKSNGELLGLFNFYVTEGHQRSEREERCLNMLADTLAGLIRRRRAEEMLIIRRDEL